VDSSTIRRADSASTYVNEDDDKAIRYVQVYDGMIITEYNQDELCFGVRNPRTDMRLYGYGVSELEMLIQTITSLLWAWEYNQKFFSQGSSAKGVLNFKGTVPEKMLQQFRRHWYQLISGIENSWKTPITASEGGLEWINMQSTNRDMEYNAWMDFLIKTACSVYSMDPVEVNFKYGNTGQKGGLAEASNKEKITESKERGLRPLIRHIQTQMNQHIIWPINENFEFQFVGLDAMTKDDMADLNSKRVKTMMTVDEIRAEDDMEPMKDGLGEVILDPTWLQNAQAQQQAEMMEEQGGQPGEGGDDDEGGKTFGDVDFEALLAENDEDEDEGGDEPAKPAKPEQAQKSMRRHRRPLIDVKL
jgi:phage portal protein BeeE